MSCTSPHITDTQLSQLRAAVCIVQQIINQFSNYGRNLKDALGKAG